MADDVARDHIKESDADTDDADRESDADVGGDDQENEEMPTDEPPTQTADSRRDQRRRRKIASLERQAHRRG